MQPRVSLIIPLYNKVNFVDRMFRSVCNQKWDNVEVVLSCRKSTDGTDEKIDAWIPELLERGFSVVRIYGENTSLPTGTLSALKRVTGKYVCQLQSDDYISDDYISSPVEFLEENNDYDYTIAEMRTVTDNKIIDSPFWNLIDESVGLTVEDFVLHAVSVCMNRLMIRKSYMNEAKIINNFYTDAKYDQESQVFLPLIAYGGKYKYLSQPKYFFDITQGDEQLSRNFNLDGYIDFTVDYGDSVRGTLITLNLHNKRLKRLLDLNELTTALKILCFAHTKNVLPNDLRIRRFIDTTVELLKNNWGLKSNVQIDTLYALCAFIRQYIMNKCIGVSDSKKPVSSEGLIIACGCLSKTAKTFLPIFLETGLHLPDLFWDKAATGNEDYNGVVVTKPDYQNLRPTDVIFILVQKNREKNEIIQELEKVGCELIYDIAAIGSIMASNLFDD